MSFAKISKKETELIDLGDKKFYKYTSPTPEFELKKTVLNGRSPAAENKAYIEKESFAIYILKGHGEIILDNTKEGLEAEDVVYVLKGTKWAISGNLEYVVVNIPIWYPEQMEEVDI